MHFFDRKYVCVECVVSKICFVPNVLFSQHSVEPATYAEYYCNLSEPLLGVLW